MRHRTTSPNPKASFPGRCHRADNAAAELSHRFENTIAILRQRCSIRAPDILFRVDCHAGRHSFRYTHLFAEARDLIARNSNHAGVAKCDENSTILALTETGWDIRRYTLPRSKRGSLTILPANNP